MIIEPVSYIINYIVNISLNFEGLCFVMIMDASLAN